MPEKDTLVPPRAVSLTRCLDRCLSPSASFGAGCGAAGRIRDYAWVAPTYGVAERGVEAFRTIAPDFVRIVGRMPARAEFEGAAGPCRGPDKGRA
jgi:hypothetical protein